jgi:hypothetical protein
MNLKLRPLASALLALYFLFLTLACQPGANTPRRSLLIYTPHGQDMLRDFVERYRQSNPGVEVQFLDMVGSRAHDFPNGG